MVQPRYLPKHAYATVDRLSAHLVDKQKADVAKQSEAFDHVGLLVDEPPGMAGLLFS